MKKIEFLECDLLTGRLDRREFMARDTATLITFGDVTPLLPAGALANNWQIDGNKCTERWWFA